MRYETDQINLVGLLLIYSEQTSVSAIDEDTLKKEMNRKTMPEFGKRNATARNKRLV
jgi:hypothetical protein